MRLGPFITGVVLAGIIAGLGSLISPPHTAYAIVVGLAVAMPLLRPNAVGLPEDPSVADRVAGDRALNASVGALVGGAVTVYVLQASFPGEGGLPVYAIAASAAVAGSFVVDIKSARNA
ncbi:MAG: hypothetical protein ABEH78_04140 [Haloferacaceae archaeon]